jgi:hypothetical protein
MYKQKAGGVAAKLIAGGGKTFISFMLVAQLLKDGEKV